jgi:hypothetical protein
LLLVAAASYRRAADFPHHLEVYAHGAVRQKDLDTLAPQAEAQILECGFVLECRRSSDKE